MRLVNIPMRALFRLPLPTPLGYRLMLVTITGDAPAAATVNRLATYETATPSSPRRWALDLNLRPDQPNNIRLRGRDFPPYPDVAVPSAIALSTTFRPGRPGAPQLGGLLDRREVRPRPG